MPKLTQLENGSAKLQISFAPSPPGTVWQSLETFVVVTTSRRVVSSTHLMGRGCEAAKYLLQCAKVEKLYSDKD